MVKYIWVLFTIYKSKYSFNLSSVMTTYKNDFSSLGDGFLVFLTEALNNLAILLRIQDLEDKSIPSHLIILNTILRFFFALRAYTVVRCWVKCFKYNDIIKNGKTKTNQTKETHSTGHTRQNYLCK